MDRSNTTDVTYTVEWQKTGCLAENQERNSSITTINTSYSITGLEEGSKYNITVSAGKLSNTVSAVTIEKGQGVVLMSQTVISNFTSIAPSVAPKVLWSFAASYSITLQWETVPCGHRNRDITCYSIKYGEIGSLNNKSEALMNIAGASVTEATIFNLMLSTNYSIQFAAVNNAGTGVFSNATFIKTVEQSDNSDPYVLFHCRCTSLSKKQTHSQQ